MTCRCLICGRIFTVRDPTRAKSFTKCPECAKKETSDVVKDMLNAIRQDQYRHNKEFRKKKGLS